ncbi:MAG: hypothetical protein ILO36_05985, partial [Abditibacteriota bacterium]|nr:hypothetical protein [Abditibacteriota bacterium]
PLNTSGFGIYTKEKGKKEVYAGFVYVPINCGRAIDASVPLSGREQTVTVAMPLYGCVKTLYIGVTKGSMAVAAPEYKTEKPGVFYGSSITQGGCASRPGNSYQGIMSRSMDMNYINLGFSGSGRGEKTIADYTAGLDMSAFVLDYDHNAPTAEHLQNTHYAFYETVRAAHPDIPIVMVTRPVISPSPDEKERIRIVRASWEKAKKNGDKNVYFIDGSRFMQGYAADAWCVDGTHPNDFGFVLMAKAMEKVLKPLL